MSEEAEMIRKANKLAEVIRMKEASE